jgi:hypothetical protein
MKALATALLALALLPAAALAKSGLMLESTPDGVTAGQPWDARFQFVSNDAAVEPLVGKLPYVRIMSSADGSSMTFPARRAHNGSWVARVVFPRPGEWTYTIKGFPPAPYPQVYDPVQVAPTEGQAPPAVVAASTAGGSSFPYLWVVAGSALALAAAGLLVRRLRA